MKKFLLVSVLLSLSVLMQAMDDNQLVVRMGGYSGYGAKDTQEDRFICGVIEDNKNKIYCTLVADGHSGDKVSSLLQARFLPFVQQGVAEQKPIKDSLFYAASQCEKLALENENYYGSGSTVLASCFDTRDSKVHILWIGDSRAVFGGNKFFATLDHKPTEEHEKERIEKSGNKIDEKSGKLHGLISVSRSIGDFEMKSRVAALTPNPDYVNYSVAEGDYFYIGASDGFWDVVETDEVAHLVSEAKSLSEGDFYQTHCDRWSDTVTQDLVTQNNQHIEITNTFEDKDTARIARRLVHVALYRGSKDNITVVVTLFGNDKDVHYGVYDTDEDSSLLEYNSSEMDAVQNALARLIDGDDSGSGEADIEVSFEESGCEFIPQQGNEKVDDELAKQKLDNKKGNNSTSSSELESFEFPKSNIEDKPVIPQVYWKTFIQNHKYKIGGLATMLAIIIAAYKYNYLHLNYMAV